MTLREIFPDWFCKFTFNKITVCRDLTIEEFSVYLRSHFKPQNISGRIIKFEHPLPSREGVNWESGGDRVYEYQNWENLISFYKRVGNLDYFRGKGMNETSMWNPMTPLEHIEKYDLVRLNWMDFTLGESGFTILLLMIVWILFRIVYRKVFKKI